MVEVRYQAQLGNNLFQYCFGRILAEGLGFQLAAGAIPGFPNTQDVVAGERHDAPEQVLSGHDVGLAGVLADRRPRRIVLDGWFQRYDYYRPHRERIRRWLAFDAAVPAPHPAPDTVVHVRRGDYVTLGWALPFSFYEQALARLSPRGSVCILTDDPRDPFFEQFARWQPVFPAGNALAHLRLMSAARRIVMSQSTYSWWPTFLGAPDQVVCPAPAFGPWSPDRDGRNATLIERDRFICLDVAEPYRPAPREQRHQEWRAFKRRAVLAINRRLGLSLPEPPR
jgi:hypothetical protein